MTTIEVKPSTASASSIAWSPVQARQYADYFQSWLDEHGDEARTNLMDLMRQQQRIGMRPKGPLPSLQISRPVKAVVAVDARAGTVAMRRLREVVAHFDSAGLPLDVEVMRVDLIGRLTPLGLR